MDDSEWMREHIKAQNAELDALRARHLALVEAARDVFTSLVFYQSGALAEIRRVDVEPLRAALAAEPGEAGK